MEPLVTGRSPVKSPSRIYHSLDIYRKQQCPTMSKFRLTITCKWHISTSEKACWALNEFSPWWRIDLICQGHIEEANQLWWQIIFAAVLAMPRMWLSQVVRLFFLAISSSQNQNVWPLSQLDKSEKQDSSDLSATFDIAQTSFSKNCFFCSTCFFLKHSLAPSLSPCFFFFLSLFHSFFLSLSLLFLPS